MGKIQTVLKWIDSSEVQCADVHDHLTRKEGKETDMSSSFILKDADKTAEELGMFRDVGGNLIVDAQPLGGRYIENLVEASKRSGVHVVASTGFHEEIFYFNDFWGRYIGLDEIVPLLISEITEGIEINSYGFCNVKRAAARAGVCKCAGSYQVITPEEEKWIRCAALTSSETGVPVITHTNHGTMGLEMLSILKSEGMDLAHVIMGHLDRNPDLHYILKAADTGCYIQFDGPSRVKYYPDDVILGLMRQMADHGHLDQILLAGDMGKRVYHKAYGGGPGIEYILKTFVPRMLEEGFTQEEVDRILRVNPARALSFYKEA